MSVSFRFIQETNIEILNNFTELILLELYNDKFLYCFANHFQGKQLRKLDILQTFLPCPFSFQYCN